MRATPLIVFGAILAILIGVVWSFTASPGAATLPAASPDAKDQPKPAPDLTIRTATSTIRLADLKGKVVLVDFWATWCGPCRMSIPTIEAVYKKLHAHGFEVLGVSIDSENTARFIPTMVKALGMTYPVGRPTTQEAAEQFRAMSIPQAVLVDKRGMIVWSKSGVPNTLDGQIAMQNEIEGLVGKLLAQ